MLLNRTSALMLLNHTGGMVWAPETSLRYPFYCLLAVAAGTRLSSLFVQIAHCTESNIAISLRDNYLEAESEYCMKSTRISVLSYDLGPPNPFPVRNAPPPPVSFYSLYV
jgi:hypothetical protein